MSHNFAIGHNLSGYTPESDVYVVGTWEEAIEALKNEMRSYAERDDDAAWDSLNHDWQQGYISGDYVETAEGVDFGDDTPSMLATVESIIADEFSYLTGGMGPFRVESGPIGFHIEDNDGRMIYFWVAQTDEPTDDDDQES